MSAKKKSGGAKKGQGDGQDELIAKLKDDLKKSQLRIETLERYLVLRSEQAQRARMDQEIMQERMRQVDDDFEKEKSDRLGIAADMVRQYKAMQDDLLNQINELSNKNLYLKDKLALANVAIEQLKREKELEIERKDQEIKLLKQKIQDMVSDFGDMLRETLEKMSQAAKFESSKLQDDVSAHLLNNAHLREMFGDEVLKFKAAATGQK